MAAPALKTMPDWVERDLKKLQEKVAKEDKEEEKRKRKLKAEQERLRLARVKAAKVWDDVCSASETCESLHSSNVQFDLSAYVGMLGIRYRHRLSHVLGTSVPYRAAGTLISTSGSYSTCIAAARLATNVSPTPCLPVGQYDV